MGLNAASAHPTHKRKAARASSSARCAAALQTVQGAGLVLPSRFGFRCPGDTRAHPGDRNWGIACYYYAPKCPGEAYVAINPTLIGPSDARLRYVVAHEIAHAIELVAQGSSTEESADAQARAAGFPPQ
ncbi:MAG: hypothetical protein M3404_01445 [Actinomycetota bacterium]|nr:hypothetical protein [Actinomycetota bacterium]